MNKKDLIKVIDRVTWFYPKFELDEQGERSWLMALEDFTAFDATEAVKEYLSSFPPPKDPPAPGVIARLITQKKKAKEYQPPRRNMGRLYKLKNMVKCEVVNDNGTIQSMWYPIDECVIVGQYMEDGELFELGMLKMEFVLMSYSSEFISTVFMERLGISEPNEMLDPKKKHLLGKYRELRDELVELARTKDTDEVKIEDLSA